MSRPEYTSEKEQREKAYMSSSVGARAQEGGRDDNEWRRSWPSTRVSRLGYSADDWWHTT